MGLDIHLHCDLESKLPVVSKCDNYCDSKRLSRKYNPCIIVTP